MPTRRPSASTPRGATITRAEVAGVRLMVLSLPDELPSGVAAVLSAAEIDVATGLLRGEPYASMARRRGTSDRTIAKQVRAIFKKLQVRSRSELVRKVRLDG